MPSSKQPSSKKIDPPTQPVESQNNGLLKSPSNTESSPHHQTRADICGLVFGVACIPLVILWSLVMGLGPVLLLVVLVNASGMAGLVSALVFPWKKLSPMAVQPVTARLALRAGLVATLVGGSLAVSYLAFRRIFVEKSAGFISSGQAIFVAFLSILPALLTAGIAARLVASRFVQNSPSIVASDAVVGERSNRPWYRRGLSPVVSRGVCSRLSFPSHVSPIHKHEIETGSGHIRIHQTGKGCPGKTGTIDSFRNLDSPKKYKQTNKRKAHKQAENGTGEDPTYVRLPKAGERLSPLRDEPIHAQQSDSPLESEQLQPARQKQERGASGQDARHASDRFGELKSVC